MKDSRLSTGLLKGTMTEEELAALKEDMARTQRGYGHFPWWALREAIEEWKKRGVKRPENDERQI